MTKLLIYSFIVMTLIIISLFVVYKKVKDETKKDNILKIFAILTVIIHFSSLWVDYLTTGSAEVENTMLFPIYPCNICMWLLLIVSFMKKKDSFIYKTIAEFLAIGGTLCGLIGLFANEIFLATPEFSNWDSLKGLLSHTTMIFGTLFLLTQGYVKIRAISLTISCTLGLLLFAVDGVLLILLFRLCKLPEINIMFMLDFPLDIKGANFMTLGLLGGIVSFIIGNIFEFIFVKKEDRWYYRLNKNNK